MQRKRLLIADSTYHVTSRINGGDKRLRQEKIKNLYLDIVKRAKEKYSFELINFCIMNNHVHLVIKPLEDSSLSRIMQWISSVFAKEWNKLHHRTGHVWGERFFSRIIAGAVDLVRVFMYIDDNPVEAGLVRRPEEWKFGGLWHHKKEIFNIVKKLDTSFLRLFPDYTPG